MNKNEAIEIKSIEKFFFELRGLINAEIVLQNMGEDFLERVEDLFKKNFNIKYDK